MLGDRDVHLWPSLKKGVPLRIKGDIPPSNTFIPVQGDAWHPQEHELRICTGNWPGAEQAPDLLEDLIRQELDAGYLEPVASLQAAKERWAQVAVGKANVIQAPGRKPRLIIDPTWGQPGLLSS